MYFKNIKALCGRNYAMMLLQIGVQTKKSLCPLSLKSVFIIF